MTTRPLDLASKLRPPPANFDWLFFVNVGLIAVFFGWFGSPLILAPSLGVDFRLPEMAGANAEAQPATHYLNVTDSGQVFVGDGSLDMTQLGKWLGKQMAAWRQAKHAAAPVLRVQASANVSADVLTQIFGMAQQAGFTVRQAVEEPKAAAGRGGR
jgi:biopolymer transport protein ExbD